MHKLNEEVLKNRKRKTLQAAIHHYISTGKPVSSKSVTENYDLALSSASVRKILKELDTEGYLLQPYTSSGRMPTDKGYRWFVDRIVELQNLAIKERNRILEEYKSQISEIDELLQKTSHLLTITSNYAGFIITPKANKATVKSIQLIKLSDYKILIMIATNIGAIKHYILNVDIETDSKLLTEISEILNDKFANVPLSEFKNLLFKIIDEIHLHKSRLEKLFTKILTELFQEDEVVGRGRKIYIEGTRNILPVMDIKDFKNLSAILKFIEQKQMLLDILEGDFEKLEGVKVTIGKEHRISALKELSIIKTAYKLNEIPVGVLGIIGPKRMPYSKMISLVEFISSTVNKILEKIAS
ncbi:MAG: heat-inducible transcriptional repressor HrcA [Elusimicrobiota bacterium]|nr:heat-inducible transcriptional repressor HrcA [Elusimicrobiota bacterium]